MTIAELVAKISLKGGKEAVSTMQGLVKSTMATKVALIGAATALYKMSEAARNSAMFMDMYQLNTGLSAQQLQKLSFKASQAGVSMQELGGTIQKLQQMSANARLGYGWDPILTRFGLTPGQDPVTQLDRIGAALRRLGASYPAEAKALASKVGLSDSMYYALMRGTTEEMDAQLVLTDKEQKSLVKLNQQWAKFWFYIKQITMKIQALTSNFQSSFVRVLMRASKGFYELFKRINAVAKESKAFTALLVGIGLALTYAFAPELLILGAIALALEDIYTYFEGGDSITGRIIDWVKQSELFKEIWEDTKSVFKGLEAVFNAVAETFKFIYNQVKQVVDAFMEIPAVKSFIQKETEGLKGVQKAATSDIAKRAFKQSAKTVLNPLGSNVSGFWFLADYAKPAISGVKQFTQNIKNTFNISSTGDSEKDAEIASNYERGVAQTQGQLANRAEGGKNGGTRYPSLA